MLRCILDVDYGCVGTQVWLRRLVALRVGETRARAMAPVAGQVLLWCSARASLLEQLSRQPQPRQCSSNSTPLDSACASIPPFGEEYFCHGTLFTEMRTKGFENDAWCLGFNHTLIKWLLQKLLQCDGALNYPSPF